MCIENMVKPQMALIQGPPGTGKTSTIVAMILQVNILKYNLETVVIN